MNLAILNTQQQEQKAIEEMKKYTDLFREVLIRLLSSN